MIARLPFGKFKFSRNITQNNRNRKKLTVDAQAKTKIRRLLNEIVLFSFYVYISRFSTNLTCKFKSLFQSSY